jgi:DNA-binding transcriptional MerR regulator
MTIAEVAAKSGVRVETLRYYERRGLLGTRGGAPSGSREYADDAVRVVGFIKRAQELGFTLADIRVLLGLAAAGPGTCGEVRALASAKIHDLDSRIAALRAMRHSLDTLVKNCDPRETERECSLLASIGAIE